MPARKPWFVVSLGKTDAVPETSIRQEHARKPFPVPTREELMRTTGVSVSKGRIVIDWKFSAPLRTLKVTSSLISAPFYIPRLNAERIAVIKQLQQLGYRIAVPKYPFQNEKIFSRVAGHARVFKAGLPPSQEINVGGQPKNMFPSAVLWARDMWKKIGKKRFKRFVHGDEGAIGEGGRSIPLIGQFQLANHRLATGPIVNQLQEQGHRFYFMEDGETYSPRLSALLKTPVFEKHDHLDMLAGCDGQKVLLVDRTFFEQNKMVFGRIAYETGLQIVFVPKSEEQLYPANFLVLEPGKILMDRDAKETIALLREKGVEVIPTTVSMRAHREAGGNVRCMVNEL